MQLRDIGGQSVNITAKIGVTAGEIVAAHMTQVNHVVLPWHTSARVASRDWEARIL